MMMTKKMKRRMVVAEAVVAVVAVGAVVVVGSRDRVGS